MIMRYLRLEVNVWRAEEGAAAFEKLLLLRTNVGHAKED
jgi:hypothetical protein